MIQVIERWRGDRRWWLGLAIAGVIFLGGSAAGWALEPGRALVGYLFAFDFWVGISVASLMLLAIWHASGAKWPTVLRRYLEVQASTVTLFPLLFLPVAIGVKWIFPWAAPFHIVSTQVEEKVLHQHAYLNVGFFEVRAGIYFLVWIAVAESLLWLSRKQDEDPNPVLTKYQRMIGAGSLPLLGFSLSFAALDWIMSLDPTWPSTIFGIYYWVGSLLGAFGALAIVTVNAEGPNLFGALTNPNHRASLGKFMLAFTAFWAYIAYDQFMLVWIADLPGEVHWFKVRISPGWGWYSICLMAFRFAIPFAMLLSRRLKLSRRGLAFAGGWLLFGNLWDVYWMVLPSWDEAHLNVHWEDPVALIAVGLLTAAFALWRITGERTVPVGDPYLFDSLRYDGQ